MLTAINAKPSTVIEHSDGSAVHFPGTQNSNMDVVAKAALQFSDDLSASRSEVAESQSSFKELQWQAMPQLIPSASLIRESLEETGSTNPGEIERETRHRVRLTLAQELFDFGRHKYLSEQANTDIAVSKIVFWQERNQSLYEALELYIDLLRHKSMANISEHYNVTHNELLTQIEQRVHGGVADRSELALIQARRQELTTQRESDVRTIAATEARLSDVTGLSTITQADQDELDIPLTVPVINVANTPSVIVARKNIEKATAIRGELKTGLYPRFVAEAYVENINGENDQAVGVRLQSDSFSGFSYRAKLTTASARLNTAKVALNNALITAQQEIDRLNRTHDNLQQQHTALLQQKQQIQQSISLFLDQYKNGVKPILDAISLFQSALTTERQIIDAKADIKINRISLANFLGALANPPE